jgi:hypothetical protein
VEGTGQEAALCWQLSTVLVELPKTSAADNIPGLIKAVQYHYIRIIYAGRKITP